MRKIQTALLAGIVAIAATGTAFAAAEKNHVLNVALPDGSVEQIHYTGDVAPRVVLVPTRVAQPIAFDPFDAAPFAMLDRMAAEMDRQSDAMLRQAAMMANQPATADGKIDTAAFAGLPAGTVHYSFVSTSTGNGGTCTRSVQVTSQGPKLQPRTISHTSGDCGAAAPAQATPAVQGVAPAGQARPIQAKLDQAKDHGAPTPARTGPTI